MSTSKCLNLSLGFSVTKLCETVLPDYLNNCTLFCRQAYGFCPPLIYLLLFFAPECPQGLSLSGNEILDYPI